MDALVEVATNVVRSPRVLQVEGMFDVPPTQRVALSWRARLPIEERPWNVGLIVGPSGCGKSTVARKLFGEEMAGFEALRESWTRGRSLLDSFPAEMGIKDIVELLSSVGFSSPPSWVRPFEVLSNGEQFRVLMARVLAETRGDEVAVVDEFTSVVDRTVAQIGSCAIAKTVRRRGQRFVAVTCHEDVEPWLQPDWVYRPTDQSFTWRSLQRRPAIDLEVYRTTHEAWRVFAPHHYLNHDLNRSAVCFVACLDGRPVAFDSWLPHVGRIAKGSPPIRRSHRVVCLPDYQGAGIGHRVNSMLASMWRAAGYRAVLGTSHPGFIGARLRDPTWKMLRAPNFSTGKEGTKSMQGKMKRSSERLMASFEYVGPAMDTKEALALLGT